MNTFLGDGGPHRLGFCPHYDNDGIKPRLERLGSGMLHKGTAPIEQQLFQLAHACSRARRQNDRRYRQTHGRRHL